MIGDSQIGTMFELAQHLWKDLHMGNSGSAEHSLHHIIKQTELKDKRSMAEVLQIFNSDNNDTFVQVRQNNSPEESKGVNEDRNSAANIETMTAKGGNGRDVSKLSTRDEERLKKMRDQEEIKKLSMMEEELRNKLKKIED